MEEQWKWLKLHCVEALFEMEDDSKETFRSCISRKWYESVLSIVYAYERNAAQADLGRFNVKKKWAAGGKFFRV